MSLNPLVPYLLKIKRINKKLTIDQVAQTFDFDKTYLSKVENNKIQPTERKLKQLYYLYGIKLYSTNYLDFTAATIHTLFNKIYYIKLENQELCLLKDTISKHNNSIYLGHLCLVMWCYKSLNGLWDDIFLSDVKSFLNLFDLFTIEEQNFFLLCLMFYYARNQKFDKYLEYENKLNQIKERNWLGLEYYIKISYYFNSNDFIKMSTYIQLAKDKLIVEKNFKRLNSVLQYEAMYYNTIGHFEKEIEIYNTISNLYKKENQLINYGAIQQNIGSLLMNERKYKEAINHYIEGLKYNSLNGPYFELAWCYYLTDQKQLCKEAIKNGKNAEKQLPVYSELFDWLLKMLDNPYSKSCLNLLLKVEKEYKSKLNEDIENFIYITIANTYKELNEIDMAYTYLKKVLNKNIIIPFEIV